MDEQSEGYRIYQRAELDDFIIRDEWKSIHTQVFVTADGMKSDEMFRWLAAGRLENIWRTPLVCDQKGGCHDRSKNVQAECLALHLRYSMIEQMIADQKLSRLTVCQSFARKRKTRIPLYCFKVFSFRNECTSNIYLRIWSWMGECRDAACSILYQPSSRKLSVSRYGL